MNDYEKITSTIKNWQLGGQTVFLRIDGNVPLKNGMILDDARLQASRPTLDLLRQKGARIIITTHLGRPKNQESDLSTHHLVPWFRQHGYEITFAPTIKQAKECNQESLILLENLRFFIGEQAGDAIFAQELAGLATFFVNDAWGAMHRYDASIAVVPHYFDARHKSIGLLVEREMHALEPLLDPKHPYAAVLGGKKIKDKLLLLMGLLTRVDTVILLPPLVFTLLAEQEKRVHALLNEESFSPEIREYVQFAHRQIAEFAKLKKIHFVFPKDYTVESAGGFKICAADNLDDDDRVIAVGPQTVTEIRDVLSSAKTIIFAGLMGFADKPDSLKAFAQLVEAASSSQAYTVVAGGDSCAAIKQLGLENKINFCSTGGNATLAFISGAQMPGLDTFVY